MLGALKTVARKGVLKLFAPGNADEHARERHKRILKTWAASGLSKVLSTFTTMLTVPLTLKYLGVEQYGMWMTMSSFVAMLSFADFGIGSGLMNSVSAAYGRDDNASIKKYASSGLLTLGIIAATLGACYAAIYHFVSWADLFNVHSTSARSIAGPAFTAVVACLVLAIPLGLVQRVQSGMQQGFSVNIWQGLGSIATLALVILFTTSSASLPWLIFAIAGTPLVVAVFNYIVFFFHQRPDIAPSLKFASTPTALALGRTGAAFFGVQMLSAAFFSSDNLIISHILGPSAVSEYAVTQRLFNLVSLTLIMFLIPLWPAYREALVRGDVAWARRTLTKSTRLMITLSALGGAAILIASPWFLPLWLGNQIHPELSLMIAFAIWKVVEMTGISLGMFLNGANAVTVQLVAAFLMFVVGLPLKLVLIHKLGLSGLIVATIAVYLFINIPIVFGKVRYLLA